MNTPIKPGSQLLTESGNLSQVPLSKKEGHHYDLDRISRHCTLPENGGSLVGFYIASPQIARILKSI